MTLGKSQTISKLTYFYVLWKFILTETSFWQSRISGWTIFTFLLDSFSARNFDYTEICSENMTWQFFSTTQYESSARKFGLTSQPDNFQNWRKFFGKTFLKPNSTSKNFKSIWLAWRNQSQLLTNAIANAGFRVRWNIGILYIHLYWLTVEQQFNPALAIASAVMCQFITTWKPSNYQTFLN